MVKCTRSTEGSDFSRLRQVRSPACGSPETSSTRSRSRTPETETAARLLASVSSLSPGTASISTTLGPRRLISTPTCTGSPTRAKARMGSPPSIDSATSAGEPRSAAESCTISSKVARSPTMP